MYLTRMDLNTARLGAIKLISSPYRMHALVEHSFPPFVARSCNEGRVLWRIDTSANMESAALYILSPEPPDLTHAVEQVGWPAYPKWETKDYAPLLEKMAEGQVWAFRLKANPARKVAEDKGRRPNSAVVGTVQGHVTEAYQRQWLLDRAEAHGFKIVSNDAEVPALVVSHRTKERFRKGKEGPIVTLATAQYDGVLEVTDAEAFRRTLGFGIGRAKGFGCGLLTIAPQREA